MKTPTIRFLAPFFTLCSLLIGAEATARPTVGLVLGGGGARGAAHIGVLEVLERHKVKIDCIAGTSMGALVAGSYAAGLSPQVMREELAKADWRDMFIDAPDYSEQSYRNKKINTRFLPASEMGVTDKGVVLPPGVVTGQKIRLFFNHLVHADVTERHIEDLPLPLSIIATDIGNGDRIVFRDGNLTTAMRASMSVPGLLAPVEQNGHKLVDGGLVDNVPISEVHARCSPDVVIAVNVGSPLLKPEEIGSLLTVSAQMVNILTEQNVSRSLALLRPSDIYIKPDLEGITAGDFERHAETADRGRKAAEAIADKLRSLSVPDEEYAAWWNTMEIAKRETSVLEEINVAGLRYVNPGAVERHLRAKPGDTIDTQELNRDILRVYGDGYYERVEYSMQPIRDRRIMTVTPLEKFWGPDYLRFGVALETEEIDGSSYLLRGAYHKTWLNSLGAELLTTAEIGSNPNIGIEYYQPLDPQQRFFVEALAGIRREHAGLYQDGDRLAEYKIDTRFASLGAGMNIGLLGRLRAGWLEQKRDAELETGSPIFDNPSLDNSGWIASLDLDQFDRAYFPTRGWKAQVRYFHSVDNDYGRIDANLAAAYSIGDYVVNARISRSMGVNDPLPTYDPASLGGLFNLSAFGKDQILGGAATYGQIRAEKVIGRMPLGLRGDLRAGLAFERGRVSDRYTETRQDGWINSTGIYFGGDTPLGPVYLGYAHSPSGSSNLYLLLGTP
ncbi:patatin-like phospholipase family protein [Propionivibrio limicola]|uniref:patatin-like phospholipase family protein n=1 Tax=Propionivibrio limicola TaxID=167645 RepID=UPI0012914946|nr:patatin-like phospholipase family protein [Propionivibrio limicola]